MGARLYARLGGRDGRPHCPPHGHLPHVAFAPPSLYIPQEELSTREGEWVAVACARPLVLKECRSLPTPLWHEVMQLCGGEFETISALLEQENDQGRAPPSGGNGPAFRNTD